MEKGAVGNTDISCSALNWGRAQVSLGWMDAKYLKSLVL